MRLPAPLAHAIENELSQFDRKALARAVEELSASYRTQPKDAHLSASFINNDVQRAAYLLTRVPATYAAIYAVLREVKERIPELEVRSLLDLGAGPGTAMWAAAEIFSELEQVTLIERCQARSACAQRNHIGLALRAFIRFESWSFRTGICWFNAKWDIVRDAVRAYLANPRYQLA